ncbi:MAG: carboxypeptidase regulatory-like domain-containing protein [Planctomycetota bacterium]
MKILRLAIPIATLVALFLGWIAARFSSRPDMALTIAAAAPPSLPPLEFPAHDRELRGIVVDASGATVPDALVMARAGGEPFWTYSDASGAFHLERLPQGPWAVCVVARGFVPAKTELTGCLEPCRIDIGAPVPRMRTLQAVVRTPLAGRVVSEAAGTYEVVLHPTLAPESLDAPVPRRVMTDAGGRFAIEDLAHGDYRLRVLPAWAESGSWPDLLRPLEGGDERAYVHDETAKGRELALELAAGSLSAEIASTSGASVEGALVLIHPASDATRVWPPMTTGADGKLVVRDLPAGEYRISVRAGSASAVTTARVVAGRSGAVVFEALDIGRR